MGRSKWNTNAARRRDMSKSQREAYEAEILLEADAKVSTRVLGADHPHTQRYAHLLGNTRHRRDQALNRARSAAAATSQVTSPL